jgi:hypothetical protein
MDPCEDVVVFLVSCVVPYDVDLKVVAVVVDTSSSMEHPSNSTLMAMASIQV